MSRRVRPITKPCNETKLHSLMRLNLSGAATGKHYKLWAALRAMLEFVI
jgi:hypothetical protein